jgi:hypothetical protein
MSYPQAETGYNMENFGLKIAQLIAMSQGFKNPCNLFVGNVAKNKCSGYDRDCFALVHVMALDSSLNSRSLYLTGLMYPSMYK